MKLFLLFFFLIAKSTFSDPVLEIGPKKKGCDIDYKYGIIGPNYGIDLKNEVGSMCEYVHLVVPFDGTRSFPYFQCFESKRISFQARSFGYDKIDKETFSECTITALNEYKNIYSMTRAIPLKECNLMISRLKKLLKKEKYACLAGNSVESEKTDPPHERYWIWKKLVTQTGSGDWYSRGK